MWPDLALPAWGILPYLKRLPEPVSGILVGVGKGENAHVLSNNLNIKELWGIDPYVPYRDIDTDRTQEDVDNYLKTMEKNLEGYNFGLVSGTGLSDDTYDFLMIDTQKTVAEDLELFYPKLRKGGYVWGGLNNLLVVMDGLRTFRDKNKVRVPINHSKNFVWFWRKA